MSTVVLVTSTRGAREAAAAEADRVETVMSIDEAARVEADVLVLARGPVPRGWRGAVVHGLASANVVGPPPARPDCFLPRVGSGLVGVQGEVLAGLGGLDPAVGGAAPIDLCYRAGLAGLTVGAIGVLGGGGPGRWDAHLRWKYHRFVFQGAGEPSRSPRAVAGWAALLAGPTVPPRALEPRDAAEAVTATPVPAGPCRIVASGTERPEVPPGWACAPPGLAAFALDRWEMPAPWPHRLVRRARACGWRLPGAAAARRLEVLCPATTGDAYLLLHAVHAWLHGADGFVVVEHQRAAAALRELMT